jgi:hypothetical protein
MKDNNRNNVGMVDFYDDEPEPINCPFCLKFDNRIRLVPRFQVEGEPPISEGDRENFLRCPQCGQIIPIFELEVETEIQDSLETIENPFEGGKFHIESIKKRTSKEGKKLALKKRRKKYEHHDSSNKIVDSISE